MDKLMKEEPLEQGVPWGADWLLIYSKIDNDIYFIRTG